ncbi:hypothetical protein DDF65_06235 [Caulobacter radicis]|uniref:Transglutaminase-like domain-containing protein n=2 Tax=Caulobacter radicis TaxID=2172650 RepID=A0A2T9JQQ3_9CAUL|nr:hypothetical protein DDF65_06235 [Caulobacter radicis]
MVTAPPSSAAPGASRPGRLGAIRAAFVSKLSIPQGPTMPVFASRAFWMSSSCWTRGLIGSGLALAIAAAVGGTAYAQATTTLPSMRFVRGELVSPSAAIGYYGAATTRSSSFTGVSGFEGRPPEVVELARALKGDETDQGKIADLILEHVRNSADTAFTFGLSKGPLGVIVDKSGTPFDQAALVVELARQSGLNARYRVGQVRLTAAQFADWTGVGDRQAACRFLANGGIPASFPEATPADCSSGGTFSTVTLLHAWAEVEVGGVWRTLDPSFKSLKTAPTRDLTAMGGFSSGAAATAAASGLQTGTQSGAPFIRNIATEQLDAQLSARSVQLLNAIRTDAATDNLGALIGRPGYVETYVGSSQWSSAPAYVVTDAGQVFSGDLPDQYRTKLHVRIEFWIYPNPPATGPAPLERQLYMDEAYGRRLEIDTGFDDSLTSYHKDRVSIELDDVALATWSRECPGYANGCTPGFDGVLQLAIDHPYVAGGGTFADKTIRKHVGLTVPVAIVAGLGEASDALAAKWGGERAEDELLPRQQGLYTCPDGQEYKCHPMFRSSAGDMTRQKLAANWLAQTSKALGMHAQLGAVAAQHHHSIGVVAWRYKVESRTDLTLVNNVPQIGDWDIVDQLTSLDIDTVVSVASKTNDANRAKAVSRAFAATAATLEGALVEQTMDLPDGASTAARFGWGNRPDEDDCQAGPRRFYDYAAASASVWPGLMEFEGRVSGCAQANPNVSAITVTNALDRLTSAVDRYASAGFQNVISSSESFLGPGYRIGAELKPACSEYWGCTPTGYDQSRQRGAALVASKYDASGNVLEIAHAIVDYTGLTKGGAGKEVDKIGAYDINKAADVLKDRFVDRSAALGVDLKSGLAGYSTPVLANVGGAAPYGLEYKLTYKAGAPCIGQTGPCTGPTAGGWVSNWEIHFSVSASAAEALGASTAQAAPASLAAFWSMQDIYASTTLSELQKDVYATLAADWWRRQMVGNVATVTRAGNGLQFIKLADGNWFAPTSPATRLLQSGAVHKIRDQCGSMWPTRRWNWLNTSFVVRGGGGDDLAFTPWQTNYNAPDVCSFTYGFKPTTWTWPKGVSYTFQTDGFGKVTGVSNNLGRSATLSYLDFVSGGQTASPVVNAAGQATRVDLLNPTPRSASVRPVPFQRVGTIYAPVDSASQLAHARPSLSYTYDAVGRVREARDGVAIENGLTPHRFFFAEGVRSQRVDPLGGRFTAYFDQDGDRVRLVDELGRLSLADYDGRHRVVTRTYPEGDVDQFKYDDRDNVIKLTKTPKLGSGLAALVAEAGYHPTWNKPAWVRDANGHQTDITYVSSGAGLGEVLTVEQPAVTGGRPTWRYEYDAYGQLTKATDPTGLVTQTSYDAQGNAKTSAIDPSGVNAQTCRTYDAVGNVVSERDPRAGICP